MLVVLTEGFNLCSYASDVTSGLSDGYEGQSEKGSKSAARRTATKLFKRRARSRLRITGVQFVCSCQLKKIFFIATYIQQGVQ